MPDKPLPPLPFRPWMRSPRRRRMSDYGPQWAIKAALNRVINVMDGQARSSAALADRLAKLEIEQRERDRAAADRLYGRTIRVGRRDEP